jgi:NAD(P)-dependent dehydrogenase (short-subunit alcohol dehydrogenase family)
MDLTEQLRFDGKSAIITGSAKGIGREIALLLAERGANVVVNGNYRQGGSGPEESVAAEIRERGGSAISVNGSVTNDAVCHGMVNDALEHFGGLDIIVNNAGTTDTELRIQDAPSHVIDEQFAVHVKAPQQLFRAAWPHLAKSGAGRVINVGSASSLGFKSRHGWGGSYAIVKSAHYGLTRQMAGLGAQFGVKANLVMPNAHSEMVSKSFGGTEFGQWYEQNLQPSYIATSSLYLMHEDCPVNGQFFSMAGGRVARILFASRDGIFDRAMTPETIRDRWDEIMGPEDENNWLGEGYFELPGQARDHLPVHQFLGNVPNLSKG